MRSDEGLLRGGYCFIAVTNEIRGLIQEESRIVQHSPQSWRRGQRLETFRHVHDVVPARSGRLRQTWWAPVSPATTG